MKPVNARWLLNVLAVAALYCGTAQLGLLFAMPGGHVTPVWPPSGLALAAVLLFGRKILPGILLGSFAANLWDFRHAATPVPLAVSMLTAAGIGLGAALTAWLGAELLRRYAEPQAPLGRVRDVCAFMGLGGVVSCLLSATNGVTCLAVGGFAPWSAFGQVWLTWWLGDTAGVFTVAPLVLAWGAPRAFPRRVRWWEAAACFALLLAACHSVFIARPTEMFSGRSFTFLLVPFLVWPALRFGQRGAATAAFLVASISVWGTIHGSGPFQAGSLNESLLVLELFLSVVSLTALCMAAVVTEQRQAESERRHVFDVLESRVAERTTSLNAANAALLLFRAQIDRVNDAIEVIDPETERFLDINERGCLDLGYTREEMLSLTVSDIDPLVGSAAFALSMEELRQSGSVRMESLHRRKDGGTFPVEVSIKRVRLDREYLVTVARDITVRKRNETLLNGQKQVLELIATGAPLAESLTALARVIEAHSPELLCSVLLLDADGTHLRHGAAPSLPEAYTRAIDGVAIGANVGSCGTAAYRREAVFVEDIATDPLWADYRAAALPHGLRACWSSPIFDAQKNVLGTFAIYYRQPGRPTPLHLRLIEIARQTAAIAISRQQAEEALRDLSGRLLQAEDEERRRIAKDLHDSTAQDLVAVMLNFGQLRDALPQLPAQSAQIIEDSIALVENCAHDIRTLSYVLHPPRLDEAGLAGGLAEYAAGFGTRADIRIRVEVAPDFGRLPDEVEIALFRVAQESLANVRRHSGSAEATLRLAKRDGSAVLEIEDRGRGLPPVRAGKPGAAGIGIAGMRERLQHLGGRLEIASGSGGTTVRAVLPLKGHPL